jgi:N-acetylmuramoyl-L-alanine amidase
MLPTSDPAASPVTRRTFLRLGLDIAGLAVTLALPVVALAAGNPVLPPRKPKPPRVLMLDPGHGGHDPGAIGRNGTREKDVTIDIALEMAALMAKEPGIDPRLTRSSDLFLPLAERVNLGRTAKADLFLSIHADSAPNPAARGLSAYTLAEKASDSFAKALAEQENRVDFAGGVVPPDMDRDVAAILFDLTARRTRNTAQRAKYSFVSSIGKALPLLENPMRSANFAVLRSPDVPSMLIETGFLSNAKDEAILANATQRQKIARLIAREIVTILQSPLFG